MAYQLFTLPKATPVTAGSVVLPGSKLYFFQTGTTTPQDTFSDSGLTTPNANPVVADANGLFGTIYLDPTLAYKATLTTSADVLIYTVDPVNDQILSQISIGRILYPISTAEIAASVTPTNYFYPYGYIERYGAAVDGSTDDRAAIMRAYAQYKNGGARIRCPSGTSYVAVDGANTYSLKFDDDVDMVSDGNFTLLADDDDYNIILIKDGANVDIYMKGISFDHGSSSVTAEATDHICIRIESSINTIRVEDLDMTGYLADAIYFRATVNGPGGYFKNVNASNGGAGRSLFYFAKGEKVSVYDSTAINVGLQPFVTAATDNTTICRNIDFVNCAVYGGGNYSTSPYHNVDRAAFYLGGAASYSSTLQCNVRAINCRIHDYGNSAGGSVPLVLGVECREIKAPQVINMIATNVGRGSSDTGIYAYLTTNAVFQGCTSTGNGKGIWMNACTDFTEASNDCHDNSTYNYDYNGPDGATSFLRADGLSQLLARGSITFSGGTPSAITGDKFNVGTITDNSTGNTTIAFVKAPSQSNYTVNATFRGFSGTAGVITSGSKSTASFRVVTFTAGVAADEGFDFEVRGCGPLVNLP